MTEGNIHGVPYSYFVNFKAFEDFYTLYITDLATIWSEVADTESIKTRLKPYENFLELSVPDLLRILKDMFAQPESISKIFLQPSADEGLTAECGTQLGLVKFSWSFECRPIDRRLAAQHIRSRFTIPALILAGSPPNEVYTNVKTVSREHYARFQDRNSAQVYQPTAATTQMLLDTNPSPKTPDPATGKPIIATITERSALQQEPPAPVSVTPMTSSADAELERRKQLEAMLAANKIRGNEKKRKLI
jgi:hypothetical protein